MIFSFVLRAGVAAFALGFAAPAVQAQAILPPPTPNADALAAQMRLLAANPRDVSALVAAGQLSTKLGDPAAALAFFGRAQAIDPGNLRIVAGKAGALVLLERPGEALRLYAQAEAGGLAMTPFLAQRGLAYDLIGQPGYAQRDYRRALLAERDDETLRRLALSLGISGKRDEAMTLLDPLLRRSDRGAWRARACILAIAGDVKGADTIAANMMAGGAGLGPFFRRLQFLSPADRAFAVHFGQATATASRGTDARLAPALAALPADPAPLPAAATILAATQPADRPRGSRRERSRRARERDRLPPVAVASVAPPLLPPNRQIASTAVTTASVSIAPLPPAPAAVDRAVPSPIVLAANVVPPPRAIMPGTAASALPTRPAAPLVTSPIAPSTGWALTADSISRASAPQTGLALPSTLPSAAVERSMPPPATSLSPVAGGVPTTSLPSPAPVVPAAVPSVAPSVTTAPATAPVATTAAMTTSAPAATPPLASLAIETPPARTVAGPPPLEIFDAPRQRQTPAAPATAAAASPPTDPPATAPAPVRRRTANDALLASIVSAITIPASELGIASTANSSTRPAEPRRPVAAKPVAKLVDAKTLATKPDAKILVAKKPDPKKPDAKKPPAQPARWWAQVAGGARAADLYKDWNRLTAKSPAAFRGKGAWTTPLRATNRLLAGPFKSESEAQSFVNAIGKDGISGFAWQSEAGQKIEKIALK